MEEKGLFLSSEDLLILVSSQQKNSILLPFFSKATLMNDKKIISQLHRLLCDGVLSYGCEEGQLTVDDEFGILIKRINDSSMVAEFRFGPSCADIFYLYITEDLLSTLVMPEKNRSNTLRLISSDVDNVIRSLIDKKLLPTANVDVESIKQEQNAFVKLLNSVKEKEQLDYMTDEIELEINLNKGEKIKKIFLVRRHESYAVAYTKGAEIYAVPYSPEAIVEEIKNW